MHQLYYPASRVHQFRRLKYFKLKNTLCNIVLPSDVFIIQVLFEGVDIS